MNYSKQIKYSPIGNYYLNLSYKHTGKYVDYNGSINTKQKADIFDLSLNKKFQNKILYIDLKILRMKGLKNQQPTVKMDEKFL